MWPDLPVVNVTWRHWSHFTGPYNDQPATGEILELVGSAVVRVDSELRVQEMELFYDPTPFMMKLNGGKVECPGAATQS